MGERARKELKSLPKKGVLNMKNLFKRTLALILAMLTVFSIGIAANAVVTDNGWWTLDVETGNLIIRRDVPNYENPARAEWVNIRNSVKSITVEEGVKSLGDYAFVSLTKVEKVELPQTLESIGRDTFRGLSRITEIDLPQNLTSIGKKAFASCGSLTDITIPAKVKHIDEGTFWGCANLENVTITGSRTLVWKNAFNRCENLKTLRITEGSDFYGAAFGENCNFPEAVYYTGTEESYKAMYGVENGYLQSEIIYYNQPATSDTDESAPVAEHTPGKWEIINSRRAIKRCTECSIILVEKVIGVKDIPAEEIAQPEESTTEEVTQPEETTTEEVTQPEETTTVEVTQPEESTTEEVAQPEETTTMEENAEPEGESSVFEKIAGAFEEIISTFTLVFSKIAEWFTF